MAGLLDPLDIRHLALRNRIVLPPMGTSQAESDGATTDAIVEHYAKMAQAGVGLIIVEHTYVLPSGKLDERQLGIYNGELVPGLKRLSQAVHRRGAKVGLQITHAGARTSAKVIGMQPLGASDIPISKEQEVPRPASGQELEEISDAFASAAKRAVEAEFDLVEIHGAHGYLLGQFLSPFTNNRSDSYGGTFENRCRFPSEVVGKVRHAVGHDFILFYRLGADDLTPGGLTIEESTRFAPLLVKAGIDCIDVSGGLCGGSPEHLQSIQGYFVPLAEAIKKAVEIPVMVAGGITEPEFADMLVRAQKVDLVAVGRAQAKDPNWAARAREALGKTSGAISP